MGSFAIIKFIIRTICHVGTLLLVFIRQLKHVYSKDSSTAVEASKWVQFGNHHVNIRESYMIDMMNGFTMLYGGLPIDERCGNKTFVLGNNQFSNREYIYYKLIKKQVDMMFIRKIK